MIFQGHFLSPEGPFHRYLSRVDIDHNWFYAEATWLDKKSDSIIACVETVLSDAAERLNRCSEAEWGGAVVSPILRLISRLVDSTIMIEVLVSCEQNPLRDGLSDSILLFIQNHLFYSAGKSCSYSQQETAHGKAENEKNRLHSRTEIEQRGKRGVKAKMCICGI